MGKKKVEEILNLKKLELKVKITKIIGKIGIDIEAEANELLKDMLEIKGKNQGFFWGRIYAKKGQIGEISEKIKENDEIVILLTYEDEYVQEQIVKNYMLQEKMIKLAGIEGKIKEMKLKKLNNELRNALLLNGQEGRSYIKFVTPTILATEKDNEENELTFENIINAIIHRIREIEKRYNQKLYPQEIIKKLKKPKVKMQYININGTYIDEELAIKGTIIYKIEKMNENIMKFLALGDMIGIGSLNRENIGITNIELKRN
ncbi:MAG: CRISPR system precrRNA processing endoribonuclease RAMP protein Cas6 [Candidatus Heimdallarchaeaceae archaeon]